MPRRHTRYSTTGSSHIRNAQPLTGATARGHIAVAHNGNLTNAAALREDLEDKGAIFQTTVDSEIILHLLAQPTLGGQENNLIQTFHKIEGAYSLVIMTETELIGVRDPYGFRPLCIGKVGEAWVLSSETCALDLIHAKFIRDVEPGEIVIINEKGLKSIQAFPAHERRAFCIFEYVYFARPDSNIVSPQRLSGIRVNMGLGNWRANTPSRPKWWCPCRTAELPPPWATRSSPRSRLKWPLCATTTWGAASSNPPN